MRSSESVVEAGVAQVTERTLHVRRRRAPLEHVQEVRLEGLRAEARRG